MKNILEFSKIISGIFSNREQALENPKNYAHIQIHIRPLLYETFNCFAFYSEQRYQHDIWNPYKQCINKLSYEKETFILSTHRIEHQDRFTGGALDISLLKEISKYKLHEKLGCSMHFREINSGVFIGKIESGEKCFVQNGDKKNYVKSEVILNKNNLITEDSGYDLITDKKVWGSKFGPLTFRKIDSFDCFIDRNWAKS